MSDPRKATPHRKKEPVDEDSPRLASYTTPWDVEKLKTLSPAPADPDVSPRSSNTLYWNPKTARVTTPVEHSQKIPIPDLGDTRAIERDENRKPRSVDDLITVDPTMESDFAERDTLNTQRAMVSLSDFLEFDFKDGFKTLRGETHRGEDSYRFDYQTEDYRFEASYSRHKGLETIRIDRKVGDDTYRPTLAIVKIEQEADLKSSSIKDIEKLEGKEGIFVYLEQAYPEEWQTLEDAASRLKKNNNIRFEKNQLYALAFLRDGLEDYISREREKEIDFLLQE